MRFRRRHLVLALAAAALTAAAVAVVATWRYVTEEHRLASVVEGVLGRRTGLPVRVGSAAADGDRLVLQGVRIAAGPAFPLEVRLGEVEIAGGLTPLAAPEGRRVSIVAGAVSVRAAPASADRGAVAAAGLLRALLDWPGDLTLRMSGGALTTATQAFGFDVHADKTDGDTALTLALAPEGEPPALAVEARSAPAGDDPVAVDADVRVEPERLPGLWPAPSLVPETVTGRLRLDLASEGDVAWAGALAIRLPSLAPADLDFAARFDATTGTVAVPRFLLAWGDGVRLEGIARAEGQGDDPRLWAIAKGTVDGVTLRAQATWQPATGQADTDVTAENVAGAVVARRLGIAIPAQASVERMTARVSGTLGGERPRASVDLQAHGVTTPALPGFPVDAAVSATLRLARGEAPAVEAIEALRVSLTREGRSVATLTAASRAPGPSPAAAPGVWPLAVTAQVDDLERLAPLLPLTARLRGTATLTGDLLALEPLALRGVLEARVQEGTLLDARVGLARAALSMPVVVPAVDAAAAPAPGGLTIDRVTGAGLSAVGVTSAVRVDGGRIVLPDLRYAHHGGTGHGWMELGTGPGTMPFRARLDGERVDLGRIVAELGTTAGRATGTVRYTAAAQQTADQGLVALVRFASDSDGGEIGIDAIQRLLDSGAVPTEDTGILRQTLETLRVFEYASLEGTLTLRGAAAWLDLSLRGRKRFGIFPAPVEAINLRNVPLAVLARAFAGRTGP